MGGAMVDGSAVVLCYYGGARAALLETILKFSVCWTAGTWYADVRVMWVDVTDLHRVLHTATVSAVAVHFDKTWPGGGERPASSHVSRGKFSGQHIQNS